MDVVGKENLSSFSRPHTNLTGEPGGVGFFENVWATEPENWEQLMTQKLEGLSHHPTPVIVYDHPYFAGCGGIQLVRNFISLVRDSGFEVQTIQRLTRG